MSGSQRGSRAPRRTATSVAVEVIFTTLKVKAELTAKALRVEVPVLLVKARLHREYLTPCPENALSTIKHLC